MMTKPANFPERKRQRQIAAFKRAHDMENPIAKELLAKGSQRHVRTKKHRPGGRLTRD